METSYRKKIRMNWCGGFECEEERRHGVGAGMKNRFFVIYIRAWVKSECAAYAAVAKSANYIATVELIILILLCRYERLVLFCGSRMIIAKLCLFVFRL
jgi:hypothetical protein